MKCPRCNGTGEVEMTLGEQVRVARTKLGLSQDELAVRAGVHRNSVSAFERGSAWKTELSTIRALCTVLGLRVNISLEEQQEGQP